MTAGRATASFHWATAPWMSPSRSSTPPRLMWPGMKSALASSALLSDWAEASRSPSWVSSPEQLKWAT